MGGVDTERLNKGKSETKRLPDTTLLIDKYQEWGIIGEQKLKWDHSQQNRIDLRQSG
ncbi:MAG: hypothetical protein R2759_14790 [Bacteroidales bacterium]